MPSDDSHAKPAPGTSVFLSYASADRDAARALRDTLAAAGLEVWLDEEELAGGEAWDAKIRNQIRTCTYFMPVISATTETRREGYFRREWRFAIERTLDLADDVMFLVPVVIDGTRDRGARVPEKFLSVQWLRAPGGVATPELRQLAEKLARGDALAHSPTPHPDDEPPPLAGRKGRKERKDAAPPPPFPVFPPYPEPGHHFRFMYNIVLWAGHMVHALWMRLPRTVRVIASVVIVFNIITWAFRETKRDRSTDHEQIATPAAPEKPAVGTDLARDINAALPKSWPENGKMDSLKKLVGATAHVLQAGRPVALVNFSGAGKEAAAYANSAFGETFKLLQQNGGASLSPIPLGEDADDDDALARGTDLESQFVITGHAQPQAPGEPVLLTVKLYQVKQRTVIWTETFDAAKVEADGVARQVAEAVHSRTTPPAKP